MHSIFLALQSLRTQLAQALPATSGLRHFDVSFPLNDAFDPLAWLGVQRCYPQFYWQQRSGDEELAALEASPSLILWLRPHGFCTPTT
ncbi:putative menaquinone-specific isochorismate synthase domain protein [Enterobacter hormaechei]|nr:putative menaquinone-specific isochorismate synthase domain protein [Enterobacter hormaechei]